MSDKKPTSEIESLNRVVRFEADDMTVEELEQRLELSLALPLHLGLASPQVACGANCDTHANCGLH